MEDTKRAIFNAIFSGKKAQVVGCECGNTIQVKIGKNYFDYDDFQPIMKDLVDKGLIKKSKGITDMLEVRKSVSKRKEVKDGNT